MQIKLNGSIENLPEGFSLTSLLERFKLHSSYTVAEVNGVILQKEHYSSTFLKDNDCVELIRFMGGG